jgi:hypothetical protein
MSKIRVQMPQGTGSVSVAGHGYTADEDGVVHVEHAEHVAPLVGMGGIELNESDQPGTVSTLIGSDAYPASIELPGDETIALGDLVRQTHAQTSISVDEWNNLPQRIRDILLGYQLAVLRGDIAPSDQLADVTEQRDALQGQLDAALARVKELEAAPPADQSQGDEKPTRPAFADMTKAVINEWLSANGGTPIASGSHAEHVAAAEARWLELNPEA